MSNREGKRYILENVNKSVLLTATSFAAEKHRGQTRKFNGEPYANHRIRVLHTVSQHTFEPAVLIAAVLHDVLEDCPETNYEEIVEKFGIEAATIVLSLTNDKEEMAKLGGKRAYLAKKINTLSSDELLIKLADRLDTITYLSNNEWSRKYCEETRHIFIETINVENLNTSHLSLLDKIRTRVYECELLLSIQ